MYLTIHTKEKFEMKEKVELIAVDLAKILSLFVLRIGIIVWSSLLKTHIIDLSGPYHQRSCAFDCFPWQKYCTRYKQSGLRASHQCWECGCELHQVSPSGVRSDTKITAWIHFSWSPFRMAVDVKKWLLVASKWPPYVQNGHCRCSIYWQMQLHLAMDSWEWVEGGTM